MKWLSVVVMLLLPACAGEFDMFTNGAETESGWGSPTTPDGTDPTAPGTTTEPITPGFEIERNEVRLLPFHTRLEKLVRVTGLTTEDPLFDQLLRSRYDLGDHNFGQGIGADLSWNASKMAIWVRAIQPLCNSDAMATRYALPADTAGLMTEAWGRDVAPEEVTEIQSGVANQMLDEAGQYQATCVAVLTAAEFVAQ